MGSCVSTLFYAIQGWLYHLSGFEVIQRKEERPLKIGLIRI